MATQLLKVLKKRKILQENRVLSLKLISQGLFLGKIRVNEIIKIFNSTMSPKKHQSK